MAEKVHFTFTKKEEDFLVENQIKDPGPFLHSLLQEKMMDKKLEFRDKLLSRLIIILAGLVFLLIGITIGPLPASFITIMISGIVISIGTILTLGVYMNDRRKLHISTTRVQ